MRASWGIASTRWRTWGSPLIASSTSSSSACVAAIVQSLRSCRGRVPLMSRLSWGRSCPMLGHLSLKVPRSHRGLRAAAPTILLRSPLRTTVITTSLSPYLLRGLLWRTSPDVAGNPAVHPVWLVTDRGISSVPQMIPVEVSETLGAVVHDDVQESIQMSAEEERRQQVRQRCKSKKFHPYAHVGRMTCVARSSDPYIYPEPSRKGPRGEHYSRRARRNTLLERFGEPVEDWG